MMEGLKGEIMEGLKNFIIERTPESENVSHESHDEDTRKVNQEWRFPPRRGLLSEFISLSSYEYINQVII